MSGLFALHPGCPLLSVPHSRSAIPASCSICSMSKLATVGETGLPGANPNVCWCIVPRLAVDSESANGDYHVTI